MVIYYRGCELLREKFPASNVHVSIAFDGHPAHITKCPYRNGLTGGCSLSSGGYAKLCDKIRARR